MKLLKDSAVSLDLVASVELGQEHKIQAESTLTDPDPESPNRDEYTSERNDSI